MGITLGSLAALANNIKHVPVAVLHAGNEPLPMTSVVARQQTAVITLSAIEIANHMHGLRMWRPDAKRGATTDEVRAHGSIRANVVEGSGHGQLLRHVGFGRVIAVRKPFNRRRQNALARLAAQRRVWREPSFKYCSRDQEPDVQSDSRA
jgi:hypothetical protein